MPVSRQKDIGLAGRRPGAGGVQATEQQSAGVQSDPFLKQYVIELPLVASAAEQALPFTMPTVAQSMGGFVRIKSASTGGTTQEINVGVVGTPNSLIGTQATTATGIFNTTGAVDLSGAQLAYQLGSANIVGLEAELVLTVIGSDD